MEILVEKKDKKMRVVLKDRLDTTTAPEMEEAVLKQLDGVEDLELDLAELRYMSSAGLRVFLSCQKKINAVGGTMVVKNVNELIMAIFEATGFSDILTVEQL